MMVTFQIDHVSVSQTLMCYQQNGGKQVTGDELVVGREIVDLALTLDNDCEPRPF